MLARLEAALEHERRFVDDASHELRTPLAILRTELELALRHPRSREELEQALRSAASDTERLSRLAEDLLLVARFDEGVLPLRREHVDAGALLAGVAARYEPRVREAARTLRVSETDGGLRLDADTMRLEQALENLVENALVHGAGTITLSARQEDGGVGLHVADEGPGIPPEFLERAFDRFSRVGGRTRGRGHRARARDRRPGRPCARRRGRALEPPRGRRRRLDPHLTAVHLPLMDGWFPGIAMNDPTHTRHRAAAERDAARARVRRMTGGVVAASVAVVAALAGYVSNGTSGHKAAATTTTQATRTTTPMKKKTPVVPVPDTPAAPELLAPSQQPSSIQSSTPDQSQSQSQSQAPTQSVAPPVAVSGGS